MQRFISFNGEIKTEILTFGTSNRSFRYGDGLFESIRFFKGKPLHLHLHLHRLNIGARLLAIKGVENITEELVRIQIEKLAELNNVNLSGKARLQVYRKDGGLYKPNSNFCDWFLEVEAISDENYSLNQKGLFVGIYNDLPKPVNMLSGIKTTNALNYVMAGVFANANGFDDALIINQQGNLVESISSNLFIVKGNNIVTPPVSEGPVEGILRQIILSSTIKNYNLILSPITVNMLLKADEIFLSNAIKGIQWVVAFEKQRYFNRVARILTDELNSKFY